MSRLVWIELAALLAAAFVPVPVPRVVPVFVVASAARWARGKSWAQLFGAPPGHAGAGFAIGIVALALALAAGTPAVEAVTGQAVQWSEFPIARGALPQLFAIALLVAAGSAALELALRGWVVERVLELGRPGAATTVAAIAAGGLAEAFVTDGGLAVRAGAALLGAGLGIIYVGAGRRMTAPLCARLGFALGALLLQGARLIG